MVCGSHPASIPAVLLVESMSSRVKDDHQSMVSVKSEYAVYDPVKDEETEEEEEEGDDLFEDGKLPIKNEDDDVNVKADDDDTDDECCLGKLLYQIYMLVREYLVCDI